MMRGDAAEEHVVRSRDPAPNQFAANGKKPVLDELDVALKEAGAETSEELME